MKLKKILSHPKGINVATAYNFSQWLAFININQAFQTDFPTLPLYMWANYMLLLNHPFLNTSKWQDKLPPPRLIVLRHIWACISSTALISFSTFYCVSVSSLIISASYWSALLVSTSCLLSHYVSGRRTSVILSGQTGLYLFIDKTGPLDQWRLAYARTFQWPHYQSQPLWNWIKWWFHDVVLCWLVLIQLCIHISLWCKNRQIELP